MGFLPPRGSDSQAIPESPDHSVLQIADRRLAPLHRNGNFLTGQILQAKVEQLALDSRQAAVPRLPQCARFIRPHRE